MRLALDEVSKRIVGQDMMVERLLIGMLTGGHILLEGVPGLAKTLAVRTLAEIIHASFSRIQFTPDLLPADVIGTMIFDQKNQDFHVKKGPLFAQIVLADEINRAPAKVQAALLEAMQERQVTIGGTLVQAGGAVPGARDPEPDRERGHLPAARSAARPLHAQGARRLPEPRRGARGADAHGRPAHDIPVARSCSSRPRSSSSAREISDVYMDQKLVDYIVDLVRATREPGSVGLQDLKPLIAFGASPRATLALAQAARAHAFLRGRAYVIPEDVRALAPDVLRHRVVLTFEAEAEDTTSDDVIQRVLGAVPRPVIARRSAVRTARRAHPALHDRCLPGNPEAGQGHRAPHARAGVGPVRGRVPLRLPRAGHGVRRGAGLRARRRLPQHRLERLGAPRAAPSSRRTPRSASSR